MGNENEKRYWYMLSEEQLAHARGKPFSDKFCGQYLIDIGQIVALLPAPPARLLDLGCGTGWTSRFFARCGYAVVGLDISPNAIEISSSVDSPGNPRFVVGDFESIDYREAFDCVVSYDSLHHSKDEERTIACAYRSLVPGGVYVLSETGVGHSRWAVSLRVKRDYGVIEKDMPPARTIPLLKKAGFDRIITYPRLKDMIVGESRAGWRGRVVQFLAGRGGLKALRYLRKLLFFLGGSRGVVVAYK